RQQARRGGGQGPRLGRIGVEGVQLRGGEVDQLVGLAGERGERRPAAVDRGGERLEVAGRRRGGEPGGQREEAAAGQADGEGEAERVEDRGKDVDVAHAVAHDARGEQARRVDDERDAQRRFVGEDAVRLLAVLAER